MKTLFQYPPTFPFIWSWDSKSFLENFSYQIEATKCPAKEKNNEAKKAKEEGRRKGENK